MGVVFKAWGTRLERDVAIKILHSEAGADDGHRRRLLAEGRAASALNHPKILRVYGAAVDGSSFYLVSEWLEGNSLRSESQRGALPLKRLLDLAVQIADGLAAAHGMGIVHRDRHACVVTRRPQPGLSRDGRILYFISRASDGNGLWKAGVASGRADLVLENTNHAVLDPSGTRLVLLRLDADTQIFQRL
jgi:hypothetical protein